MKAVVIFSHPDLSTCEGGSVPVLVLLGGDIVEAETPVSASPSSIASTPVIACTRPSDLSKGTVVLVEFRLSSYVPRSRVGSDDPQPRLILLVVAVLVAVPRLATFVVSSSSSSVRSTKHAAVDGATGGGRCREVSHRCC